MESEKPINTLSDKEIIKKTPITNKRTISPSSRRNFSPSQKPSFSGRRLKEGEEKATKEMKDPEHLKQEDFFNNQIDTPQNPSPLSNNPPKANRNPMLRQKDNPYLRAKVQTASGGELIIMLYEKAILNLQVASDILSLEDDSEKDLIKSSKNIQNAQEIILELLYSLDIESGSDFAKKMAGIYAFMNKELSEANIEKSNKRLAPIIQQLDVLLSAWKKANEQLKSQGS